MEPPPNGGAVAPAAGVGSSAVLGAVVVPTAHTGSPSRASQPARPRSANTSPASDRARERQMNVSCCVATSPGEDRRELLSVGQRLQCPPQGQCRHTAGLLGKPCTGRISRQYATASQHAASADQAHPSRDAALRRRGFPSGHCAWKDAVLRGGGDGRPVKALYGDGQPREEAHWHCC